MPANKQHKFIAELKEGETVAGTYLVTSKSLQEYKEKSKGQFLTITLSDRSGQIISVLWEGAAAAEAGIKPGDLVEIEGKISVFRGNLQIYLDEIERAPGPFNKQLFLPTSPKNLNDLRAGLTRTIGEITNPFLLKIIRAFFDDKKWLDRFCDCPAGYSWHQAYLGGLLEHTVNICDLARELCRKYPDLDQDLLLAGALLHDIGKMEEYVYDKAIGISDQGRLLGHIVIGAEEVAAQIKNIPDFPEGLACQLRHLIISHHGEKSSGSPKRPKTAEAAALHLIDNLDAQVSAYLEIIRKVRQKGKTWSDYIKLIDRPLFAGGLEQDQEKNAAPSLKRIIEENNGQDDQSPLSLFTE